MLSRFSLFPLVLLFAAALAGCRSAPESFASPQDAVDALHQAVASDDQSRLRAILGPRMDELKSGDQAQDRADFVAFASKLGERTQIQPAGDNEAILLIGAEAWPFPAPLVQEGGRWSFDTDAGITELNNRRIGADELAIIDACYAYIDAQAEYHAINWNDGGPPSYAAHLASSPGTRDGLYWPTAEGDPPSPLGPVMAAAMPSEAPGDPPSPFYGYIFLPLSRQGASAPGGAMDYVQDGRLIRGFAAAAFPAEYGRSGIMTFIFSADGVVYQRDLGPQTAAIVAAMTEFNPDEGWEPVSPADPQ